MKTYYHIGAGLLIGSFILLITPPLFSLANLLPWFLGSIFPDLDHPIRYLLKHRKTSLKRIIKIGLEDYKYNNQHLYPFHTAEFVLFSLLLRRRLPHYGYWLSAYLIHLFLDAIRLTHSKRGFAWLKKWSMALVLKNYYA